MKFAKYLLSFLTVLLLLLSSCQPADENDNYDLDKDENDNYDLEKLAGKKNANVLGYLERKYPQ